jgi:hypothetical protein
MSATVQFRIFLSSRVPYQTLRIKIHTAIILRVVLYGCENWSRIMKEDHRLRVFENRVLRRIFEPKRDEVTLWALISCMYYVM